MKSILPTTDITLIKGLLGHDGVYEELAYDGSPSLQEYTPEGVWLLLKQNEETCGFIAFEAMNNVMWECHIFIFKKFRGIGSEKWGKQAAEYMKLQYGATKFLAITPYVAAKKYAERVGFENVAVLSNCIRKNGELMNQYILELGE